VRRAHRISRKAAKTQSKRAKNSDKSFEASLSCSFFFCALTLRLCGFARDRF
jgi:hypothetical protein